MLLRVVLRSSRAHFRELFMLFAMLFALPARSTVGHHHAGSKGKRCFIVRIFIFHQNLSIFLTSPLQMGPRPADFDEDVIRQSPTFQKWISLQTGEILRYACREFTKDKGQDEERLMRRIMIARRNNLRDHEVLKRARKHSHHASATTFASSPMKTTTNAPSEAATAPAGTASHRSLNASASGHEKASQDALMLDEPAETAFAALDMGSVSSNQLPDSLDGNSAAANGGGTAAAVGASGTASAATAVPGAATRRASLSTLNDQLVEKEMDVAAVERTRSYRAWQELPEGCEMVYNQKYIKGHPGHDWLLRKNIWRRMRYRRDCKRMVDELRTGGDGDGGGISGIEAASAAPAMFKSSTQMHSSQNANNVKRRTRSQSKKQPKDYSIQQQNDQQQQQQHHPLPMDASMDNRHGSADDTHDSKSLDQLLDESTDGIVQTVKVGLLDATTMMTAAAAAAAVEGSNAVGPHILMSADSGSMPLGHHHSPMVAVDDEDAVAAAVAAADQEAIEAAVAAAESFGKSGHILADALASVDPRHHDQNSASVVAVQDHHEHPMDAAALDAAAKLAAAAVLGQEGEDADAVAATAAAVAAASTKDLYNVHMV
jgi:hypothetical protein